VCSLAAASPEGAGAFCRSHYSGSVRLLGPSHFTCSMNCAAFTTYPPRITRNSSLAAATNVFA
jgi:hypothetical protein